MKRKIIEQGKGGYTIYLPKKWVEKNNIKKGDEIEITEFNNKLILGGEYKAKEEKAIIDVSGQKSMIHRIVAASYKAGYDEITIKYSTSEEFKAVQERTERNMDFDITEYKQNQIKAKSLYKLEAGEFETALKKSFFSLKSNADDILAAIKNKDFNELKNIIIRDKSVDRYTDFCRRLLNQNVEIKFKRPKCVYYIVEEIEIIGDMYKDLCQEIINNEITLSSELTKLLKEINNFFGIFSELLFKFNFEKNKLFGEERERLNKKINQLFEKINKKELKAFFLITQIFNATFEMKSALLTENV